MEKINIFETYDVDEYKHYIEIFTKESFEDSNKNKEEVKKINEILKKMEVNLNNKEINDSDLLDLQNYIFRNIFVKNLRKRINQKRKQLLNLINKYKIDLNNLSHKIELYKRNNRLEEKISFSLFGKKEENNVIKLESTIFYFMYYILFIENELEKILNVSDKINDDISIIFDTKKYYEIIEEVLYFISSFVLFFYKEGENNKVEKKSNTFVLEIKKAFNETKKQIDNLQSDYIQKKQNNDNIKNFIEYLLVYQKHKEVLEYYYYKLYNNSYNFKLEYEIEID